MTKHKKSSGLVWFLVILIIFLSGVDLVANLLSFIPFIGDVFETASEVVIETIQILLTIIIAVIAGRR